LKAERTYRRFHLTFDARVQKPRFCVRAHGGHDKKTDGTSVVRCTRIGKNVVEIDLAKSGGATRYAPGSSQAAVGVLDLWEFASIEIIERDDPILDSSGCDRFSAHKACYAAIAAFLTEKLQKLGPDQTSAPRYNSITRKLQRSSFVDIAPSYLRSGPTS
jgi:hypothetical protein